MLDIIKNMTKLFSDNNITYCHWKSNIDLDDACKGVGDLDLLFDRVQYILVTQLLVGLGFKRAESNIDRQYPGIEDYFGYDSQTGIIVHLQTHYQLVTGQPLTKNYHFPIEKLMLDNLYKGPDEQLPVPVKEIELALHVCRTFTKLGFKQVARPRKFSKLLIEVQEELLYLMPSGIDALDTNLIKQAIPYVDFSLFIRAVQAIQNKSGVFEWLLIRAKILRSLSAIKRRTPFNHILAWNVRRWYLLWNSKIERTTPKRSLATGGYGVAIIGSDGAGKSSAIKGLETWLKPYITVKTFHMGRPKPSIYTKVMSRLVRIIDSISKSSLTIPHPGRECREWPSYIAWIPAYLLLSVARDRWKCYEKIRKCIGSGGFVVCDRFPMEGIELMDSPRIKLVANLDSPFYKKISLLEKSYYKKLSRLNMTFMLVVSPEVAAVRQPSDGVEYVKIRAAEALRFSKNAPDDVVIIDASASLDDVASQIKTTVWKSI